MHFTAKSGYGMRITLMVLAITIVVVSGLPATAQDAPAAPKFADPTDPDYENPMANYDPWEGFNRAMYKFNYGFEKYFFMPVVNTYRFILPQVVRQGINNFFDNLYAISSVANNLLQGDLEGTFNSSARIVFNSTIGLAGVLDPATPMGFPRDKEDFGQTLGKWGLGPGPYLVLPFYGPSSVRDGIGLGVDATINTIWVSAIINEVFSSSGDRDKLYWGLTGLYYISERARIPFRYYSTGSPFEYDYLRFIYLKYRQIEIER
jgi:phospholipid-binding lipoprotein MlaA